MFFYSFNIFEIIPLDKFIEEFSLMLKKFDRKRLSKRSRGGVVHPMTCFLMNR